MPLLVVEQSGFLLRSSWFRSSVRTLAKLNAILVIIRIHIGENLEQYKKKGYSLLLLYPLNY